MSSEGTKAKCRSRAALILGTMALAYAVFRYCVLGPVSWEQVPAYILNKAAAVLTVAYLLAVAWAHVRADKEGTRYWGRLTTATALIHVFLSFGLLKPEYYPKFFTDGSYNFTGNLILAMGVVGMTLLMTFGQWTQIARTRMIAISALAGAHVLPMGFPGWFEPSQWHGGLPPISLLSFLISLATLGVLLRILRAVVLRSRPPEQCGTDACH